MPIYEYDCPVCGRVEAIQKVSDKPLKECPTCLETGKHSKVTKMVSSSSFHLKGSGWYKTDYGSKGGTSKSTPAAESKDSTKSEDKSGSTDSKDTKPKPKSCNPGCGCH